MISATARGSGLQLTATWDQHRPVRLRLRLPGQRFPAPAAQPVVEALAAGHPRQWAGRRLVDTAIGERVRHSGHRRTRSGPWQTLSLAQQDALTGLEFVTAHSLHDDHQGVRAVTRVRNKGSQAVTLYAVASLVFADFGVEGPQSVNMFTLLRGDSDWTAEGRWAERPLRECGLPDLRRPGQGLRTRGCIEAHSLSSWPTGYELPVAVLRDTATGCGWSFQVEHNGGWLWQVGELANGLYLALSGPTDEQHQWSLELGPGESFETVPASLALETGGQQSPIDALTAFRRASQPDLHGTAVPVVFNDYMNAVYGNPSADILHPLIDAAADIGAECFVIDAGWYADGDDWWDSVGQWQPSERRFPQGLQDVTGHIRRRGMLAGLWLEPEVIGVNSPIAQELPDAAFLRRDGVRVRDHGRYHLDLSASVAVDFLDGVVDRLIDEFDLGYFKFDYNIRAAAGSTARTASAGHGLLLHNRAYLAWIDRLRQRHPALLLENCASGGMRQDFATLSRFHLQSTSDQEDPHAYAPIAAAAPMLVSPGQAGNWAYPHPGMPDNDIVFTLCTGLFGRLYLSGWLSRLTPGQSSLVARAVDVHKRLRSRLPACTPVWPVGLPRWDGDWTVAGLRGPENALLLVVWRRADRPGSITIPLPPPPPGHRWTRLEIVFPDRSPLAVAHRADFDCVEVSDPVGGHAACVIDVTAEHAS